MRRTRADESNADQSEQLVVSILSFLFADEERGERFMATTGMDGAGLRAAAADPAFPEFLLDYLCADELLLVAFAAETGREPGALEALRQGIAHRSAGS